jgi:hypothetical protein
VLGVDSLSLALARAPLSMRRLRVGSAAWLAVYLALATAIFTLVGRFIIAHQGDARRAFVAYIFPERWHDAGNLLVERLFGAQQHAVLVNSRRSRCPRARSAGCTCRCRSCSLPVSSRAAASSFPPRVGP